MTQHSRSGREAHASLSAGLERLARDAQQRLNAGARRNALARALGWYLPGCAVIAAAILALACLGALPAKPMRLAPVATLLLPVLAVLLRYAALRRNARIARAQALTFLDSGLALKGRATMTEEFLHLDRPSGFHDAAMAEARPWLEQADAGTLAAPHLALTTALRRQWPLAVLALLVLAATHWVPTRLLPPRAEADKPGAERLPPAASAALEDRARQTGGASPATARGQTSPSSAAAEGGREATARGGRDGTESGQAGTAPAQGALAATTSRAAGQQAGASANAQARGADAPSRSAMQTPQGAGRQAPETGNRTANSGAMKAQAAGASDERSAPSDQRMARSDARSASPSAAPPPGSGGAAARKPSGAKSQGEGAPRRGPGQSGQGQQSQPGQGQGQGQDGAPGGEDNGTKRARGLSGLLLAVPMEDRLTGTANPGPVQTISREAPPRPLPQTQLPAELRRNGGGTSGASPQRPRSPQEDALLRRYFPTATPAAPAKDPRP